MAITDLTQSLVEFSKTISLMSGERGLIVNLAGLVGAFFVAQGLVRVRNLGSSSGYGGHDKNPWSPIFFGILLLNFWQAQGQLSDQLALTGNMLSPAIPNGYMQQVWQAIKVILNGFGLIAIFRGLLLAKAAGEGSAQGHNSPAWGALWHIVGGAILMKL